MPPYCETSPFCANCYGLIFCHSVYDACSFNCSSFGSLLVIKRLRPCPRIIRAAASFPAASPGTNRARPARLLFPSGISCPGSAFSTVRLPYAESDRRYSRCFPLSDSWPNEPSVPDHQPAATGWDRSPAPCWLPLPRFLLPPDPRTRKVDCAVFWQLRVRHSPDQ